MVNKQSRLLYFILSLSFLFLSASCSSTPSESEARKFFEEKGKNINLYEVKSFKKTNGTGNEKSYKMEYEAELQCLRQNVTNFSGLDAVDNEDTKKGKFAIKCRTPNAVVKNQGTLLFEKMETGWRVADSNEFDWYNQLGRSK